jgi:hypothetical protein
LFTSSNRGIPSAAFDIGNFRNKHANLGGPIGLNEEFAATIAVAHALQVPSVKHSFGVAQLVENSVSSTESAYVLSIVTNGGTVAFACIFTA